MQGKMGQIKNEIRWLFISAQEDLVLEPVHGNRTQYEGFDIQEDKEFCS